MTNEVTLYTWHAANEQEHAAAVVCEAMRAKLANQGGFGVSLCGNRLTLRWRANEVHMIIDTVRSVTIPDEDEEDK
jgi:hypothetical protein